jgi:uncharacterized protein
VAAPSVGPRARRLFGRAPDYGEPIRWKDIFERLEQGVDSCDHVGHVLEGIVVKHA